MRSAAIALNDKCDEVSVSSTDVLEANVASIRVDLNELKTDFRAAVSRIDSDIKGAVSKLEGEIRAMGEKAEKDLQQFADHVETRFSELRTDISELRFDNKSLRDKVDKNFERLHTKIELEIKETNQALAVLSKTVDKIDSRFASILWVASGLVALVTLAITAGKAFKWF